MWNVLLHCYRINKTTLLLIMVTCRFDFWRC